MRTPEQAKWDFVQQWLSKAEQDLRAAAVILRGEFQDYDIGGFWGRPLPRGGAVRVFREAGSTV